MQCSAGVLGYWKPDLQLQLPVPLLMMDSALVVVLQVRHLVGWLEAQVKHLILQGRHVGFDPSS